MDPKDCYARAEHGDGRVDHCLHDTQEQPTFAGATRRRCCFCGNTEEVTEIDRDHGPFVPPEPTGSGWADQIEEASGTRVDLGSGKVISRAKDAFWRMAVALDLKGVLTPDAIVTAVINTVLPETIEGHRRAGYDEAARDVRAWIRELLSEVDTPEERDVITNLAITLEESAGPPIFFGAAKAEHVDEYLATGAHLTDLAHRIRVLHRSGGDEKEIERLEIERSGLMNGPFLRVCHLSRTDLQRKMDPKNANQPCHGGRHGIISADGSAWIAEQCDGCGRRWFCDPPRSLAELEELRKQIESEEVERLQQAVRERDALKAAHRPGATYVLTEGEPPNEAGLSIERDAAGNMVLKMRTLGDRVKSYVDKQEAKRTGSPTLAAQVAHRVERLERIIHEAAQLGEDHRNPIGVAMVIVDDEAEDSSPDAG